MRSAAKFSTPNDDIDVGGQKHSERLGSLATAGRDLQENLTSFVLHSVL